MWESLFTLVCSSGWQQRGRGGCKQETDLVDLEPASWSFFHRFHSVNSVHTHVIKEQFANMDRFNGIPSNPNPIDNPLQYRISDIGQASLGSTRFSILKDL